MSIGYLDKLLFTVGISDMVSAPAMKINKTIAGMKANATKGFDAIRGGAFGLAGAGVAIQTFMQPVYDMEKALGTVKSLGVVDSELKHLKQSSLAFSIQYGESASDFVRSSYDIQSAIGGLANGELATFTHASNVLAKGTKADAATITNYMGTMYGIFSDTANQMGKSKWVEQLTGQTALAVQMFKTDGSQMSAAFTSIGADAKANGVALNEQIAILGTLQATMSGSEAGTKYKAFLAGAAGAQDKLGLSFTDSQGRLLPMLDILAKLKGKFGDTFDAAEGLKLKEAFGSQESVSLIKLLMGQTNGLSDSINKLGKVTGMDNATKMAKAMVDPWDRFKAVTEAVRISFGTLLLPTVNRLLGAFTAGLEVVIGWTNAFPNITRYVGYATLAILGLSAATGLFYIGMGLYMTAMSAWGGIVLAFTWAITALKFVLGALRAVFVGLNVVMLLNPMALMALSVVALIAGVVALVYWWSDLYDMFADTKFGAFIINWVGMAWDKFVGFFSMIADSWAAVAALISDTAFGAFIIEWVGTTWDSFVGFFAWLSTSWEFITAIFSNSTFGQFITSWISTILGGFASLFSFIADSWATVASLISDTAFGKALSEWVVGISARFAAMVAKITTLWQSVTSLFESSEFGQAILNVIDKIVGGFKSVGKWLGLSGSPEITASTTQTTKIEGLQAARTPVDNKEGAAKLIAKNIVSDKGSTFGNVTINADNQMTPDTLEAWGVMQGG